MMKIPRASQLERVSPGIYRKPNGQSVSTQPNQSMGWGTPGDLIDHMPFGQKPDLSQQGWGFQIKLPQQGGMGAGSQIDPGRNLGDMFGGMHTLPYFFPKDKGAMIPKSQTPGMTNFDPHDFISKLGLPPEHLGMLAKALQGNLQGL